MLSPKGARFPILCVDADALAVILTSKLPSPFTKPAKNEDQVYFQY
jgi:hypothetical protein